jgi:hypothetical protein
VDVVRRLVHPHRHVRSRRSETVDDRFGDPAQERPELGSLAVGERPEILAVLLRLDDDRADAERPEAMLGPPAGRFRDEPAWNLDAAGARITSEATFYGALVPSRP